MIANNCLAQYSYFEENYHTFYGGLVAGCNLSTIGNFNNAHYHKLGLNAGGVVYLKFGKHIAGSMELLYSQTGNYSITPILSGIPGVVFTRINTRLNYAEVPVMINYFDRKEGIFGIGVSFSRLVSSSQEINTEPVINLNPQNYPFNGDDFEALIGGELHLWQGLFLSIRFQYSLFQIRNEVPSNFSPTNQYNNLWVLRLMYLFE